MEPIQKAEPKGKGCDNRMCLYFTVTKTLLLPSNSSIYITEVAKKQWLKMAHILHHLCPKNQERTIFWNVWLTLQLHVLLHPPPPLTPS